MMEVGDCGREREREGVQTEMEGMVGGRKKQNELLYV
jgi:hypothetical protein